MNKLGYLAQTTRFSSGLSQLRARTWVGIGIALLALLGALIWSAVALTGWVIGQAQGLVGNAPAAVRNTTNSALEQAKIILPETRGWLDQISKNIPETISLPNVRETLDRVVEKTGTKELLGEFMPAMQGDVPQRDVSGQDLGPVERYSGLYRTQWQKSGDKALVEFKGRADYVKVLDYYAKGFVSSGFSQTVTQSTVDSEFHEYSKGDEHFGFVIARKQGNGSVTVRIETRGK